MEAIFDYQFVQVLIIFCVWYLTTLTIFLLRKINIWICGKYSNYLMKFHIPLYMFHKFYSLLVLLSELISKNYFQKVFANISIMHLNSNFELCTWIWRSFSYKLISLFISIQSNPTFLLEIWYCFWSNDWNFCYHLLAMIAFFHLTNNICNSFLRSSHSTVSFDAGGLMVGTEM